MNIVETPVFTRRVLELLSDDEYRELQIYLVAYPDAGDVIPGSGGLRKLRWSAQGRGKRGGTRVIYFWMRSNDIIIMLFMFRKNEQSDLSPEQLRRLKKTISEELL